MENKENKEIEKTADVSLRFSIPEEREYYIGLSNQLIKLLYLIEDEQKGKGSVELYFYGFIYELKSANALCGNKLTKVFLKMFGLFNNNEYKNKQHDEIKRQIFECRGIVDHLIQQLPKKEEN